MNTDYIYVNWNGDIYEKIINKHCNLNDMVMLKSITKFFVSIAIALLVHDDLLKYNDPIKKYYPKYEYDDITINDILTHKSGLENRWSYYDKDKDKYIMYKESQEYLRKKNRYLYVLKLKKTRPYGEINYNNYAYDILCYVIKKITNLNVDEYLRQQFFDLYGIRIKWNGNNGQPFGGFGLNIRLEDLPKLSNLVPLLTKINYKPIFGFLDLGKKLNKQKFFGYTGSGGQYIFISLEHKIIYITISCGNPDKIPFEKQYTLQDVKHFLNDFGTNK